MSAVYSHGGRTESNENGEVTATIGDNLASINTGSTADDHPSTRYVLFCLKKIINFYSNYTSG